MGCLHRWQQRIYIVFVESSNFGSGIDKKVMGRVNEII